MGLLVLEYVRPRLRPYVAGALAFVVTALVAHGRSSVYNNYVLMAQAFVHGRLDIVSAGGFIDTVTFNGLRYLVEAPLPAIVMMPFVAVFGSVNQTLFAIVFAAIAIGVAFELGQRYDVPPVLNAYLCGFLLAGTDLLWCAMLGDVWFLSHVMAVAFTLLVLVELAGRKRGWLVALWAGAALFCRFNLAIALPVYAVMLPSRKAIASFVSVLVPCAIAWIVYNVERWGTWYDIGYTLFYHQTTPGATGSPFKLRFFPYQLWSFWVQTPSRARAWPWLIPPATGVALTWTSPGLLYAFTARNPRKLTLALWVLVVATALPDFFYFANGAAQFGMRHALDFEPFLFALMLLAATQQKRIPTWAHVLIVYSIVAGLWGCWFWNSFVRS